MRFGSRRGNGGRGSMPWWGGVGPFAGATERHGYRRGGAPVRCSHSVEPFAGPSAAMRSIQAAELFRSFRLRGRSTCCNARPHHSLRCLYELSPLQGPHCGAELRIIPVS
jgi:hypothetical protein